MRIFAARGEDVQLGVVWLRRPGMPPRCVVRIKNPANGKSIHVEAMSIGDNFLRDYNQGDRARITNASEALVICAWHRAALGGLVLGTETELEIKQRDGALGKLRACLDHPQTVVRVSTWLGAVGFLLGLIGFGLSLWSLWLAFHPPKPQKAPLSEPVIANAGAIRDRLLLLRKFAVRVRPVVVGRASGAQGNSMAALERKPCSWLPPPTDRNRCKAVVLAGC